MAPSYINRRSHITHTPPHARRLSRHSRCSRPRQALASPVPGTATPSGRWVPLPESPATSPGPQCAGTGSKRSLTLVYVMLHMYFRSPDRSALGRRERALCVGKGAGTCLGAKTSNMGKANSVFFNLVKQVGGSQHHAGSSDGVPVVIENFGPPRPAVTPCARRRVVGARHHPC